MRSATSRSRADKSKAAANPTLSAVSNDIVPGKYTELELNQSIDEELNEEFLYGIVTELLDKAEMEIHQKYLKRRVAEYTVDKAKKAIIKILEWEFLSYDEDKQDENDVWIEDEEPESCLIDSWAQGYVPKRQGSPVHKEVSALSSNQPDAVVEESMSKLEDSELEPETSNVPGSYEAQETSLQDNDKMPEEMQDQMQPEKEEEFGQEMKEENEKIEEATTMKSDKIQQKPTKDSNRPLVKQYRGKLDFSDLSMLTETLYETEQRIVKQEKQQQEAARQRQLTDSSMSQEYGNLGQHQAPRDWSHNRKVDYEEKVIQKLFSTTIKNYKDLHPADILCHSNNHLLNVMRGVPADQISQQQRVKASHKLLDQPGVSKLMGTSTSNGSSNNDVENNAQQRRADRKFSKTSASLPQQDKILPVSMIDSIEPVAGVVIQEGDRIKKAFTKKQNKSQKMEQELTNLNPIKTQSNRNSNMIEEIIRFNDVKFKSLTKVPPIPQNI